MKVALLQYCAGADKAANLSKALALSQEAIAAKAQFILLPEVFNFRGDARNKKLFTSAAEKIPGQSSLAFIPLAKRHQAYVLLGSIVEKSGTPCAYNTSILIDPRGAISAK